MSDRRWVTITVATSLPMPLGGTRQLVDRCCPCSTKLLAALAVMLGCANEAQLVTPGGPATQLAAATPWAEAPRRTAVPAGARAALVHVDDDAALDADNDEGDVRYNPKKPLTISDRMRARCRQHLPALDRAAEKHGVDTLLLAAIAWVESGYSPNIGSSAGSRGIMQLQPGTARSLGCRDPDDVACAADAAAIYVNALLRRYHGDVVYALCAYHAGPVRPTSAWKRGELPANLHYATRVLEARARLERYGCDGKPSKATPVN